MQINIDEVTFDTEFAPKNFGFTTFFKIPGVLNTSAKMNNFYLIRGVNSFFFFFSWSILLIESIKTFTNILIPKVIRVIHF